MWALDQLHEKSLEPVVGFPFGALQKKQVQFSVAAWRKM
jgi:hypothetical protein